MDTEWLKTQLRLNPDKTKAELAKAIGLEPPAISKILAGTRQIKANEYVAMRGFFNLPTDGGRAVSRQSNASTGYVLQPLREKDTATDQDSWIMPASILAQHTKATPEQIRVFPIQDMTMSPNFMPGEHVLVDLSDTSPSPPGLFVVSDGVGHVIRQCEIVPHSSPVQIRLHANNHHYGSYIATLDQAGLVGRVIAKLQWL